MGMGTRHLLSFHQGSAPESPPCSAPPIAAELEKYRLRSRGSVPATEGCVTSGCRMDPRTDQRAPTQQILSFLRFEFSHFLPSGIPERTSSPKFSSIPRSPCLLATLATSPWVNSLVASPSSLVNSWIFGIFGVELHHGIHGARALWSTPALRMIRAARDHTGRCREVESMRVMEIDVVLLNSKWYLNYTYMTY